MSTISQQSRNILVKFIMYNRSIYILGNAEYTVVISRGESKKGLSASLLLHT